MKKSEIYNFAVMAVVEANCLSAADKAVVIHELSAEYRIAVMVEEEKAKKAQEEQA